MVNHERQWGREEWIMDSQFLHQLDERALFCAHTICHKLARHCSNRLKVVFSLLRHVISNRATNWFLDSCFFRLLFRFVPLSDIHSIQNMHLENPCHNSPPRSIGSRLFFRVSFIDFRQKHHWQHRQRYFSVLSSCAVFFVWNFNKNFIAFVQTRQDSVRSGMKDEWHLCARCKSTMCVCVCTKVWNAIVRALALTAAHSSLLLTTMAIVRIVSMQSANSVAMNFNKSKISIWIRRRVAQIVRSRAKISN